jgi:1-hydroxycarotenoid 3,4-desaturase
MDRAEELDVAIVGAGVGGLACALRCAAAGARVAVFERAPDVGGKMRVETVQGRPIDAGPTVLTMRSVFDDLFEAADLNLADYLTLHPLDVLARHAWPDGTQLDLHADLARSIDAVGQFAGAREAAGFAKFHARAANIWARVTAPFLDNPRPGVTAAVDQVGWSGLWSLMGIDWHRTLWSALSRDFRDPRLRQLLGRYATYYGSSPMLAPATLALIAAVEQAGVWRVDGGMAALSRALAGAVADKGGQVHTAAAVDEILVGSEGARGLRLADGTEIAARTVVVNASPYALAAGAFGEAVRGAVAVTPQPRSLSAVTVCAVTRTRGLTPSYHTVLFSDDYPAEFEALFSDNRIPDEPTLYICAPDRVGEGPTGDERLFCLINAPATGDHHDFSPEVTSCLQRMQRLAARCGLELDLSEPSDSARRVVTTPNDFARRFPHTGGALYGDATHSFAAPLRRQGARTRIPHLHVVGGGVHPGAGVPMVAIGGRHAAQAALQDLRSMSGSRSAATPGGTSTASATTVGSRSP